MTCRKEGDQFKDENLVMHHFHYHIAWNFLSNFTHFLKTFFFTAVTDLFKRDGTSLDLRFIQFSMLSVFQTKKIRIV